MQFTQSASVSPASNEAVMASPRSRAASAPVQSPTVRFSIPPPVAPDVVKLPRRIWPEWHGGHEFADTLRTAPDPWKIEKAEQDIRDIKDVWDIIAHTGDTATLISCAHLGEPKLSEVIMIEQFSRYNEIIDELDSITRLAMSQGRLDRKKFQDACDVFRIRLRNFQNSLGDDIKPYAEAYRQVIRKSYLHLRENDYNIHVYGKVRRGDLTSEQKKERRGVVCGACKGKQHHPYDHWKWKCRHCKEMAPHHSPYACEQRPRPRTRRAARHSHTPANDEIDNEWKYDSNWDDWVAEEVDNNLD